jgi:hypothetical protein
LKHNLTGKVMLRKEKVFVDTKADLAVRDRIIAEVRKSLRPFKRDLKIVSKPEDSDIHLRLYYDRRRYINSRRNSQSH